MNKRDVVVNLKNSINKINSLVSASETNLFNELKIELIDLDYDDSSEVLYMVLLEFKFKSYSEQTLNDFISLLKEVQEKFNNLLSKVSFNNKGNLQSPKSEGGVKFVGDSLVSKIDFSHKDDEVYLELDYMFNS